MKKRFPNMPQSQNAPGLLPVEAERSTIHLVTVPQVMPGAAAVVVPTMSRSLSRKSQHIRESEKMSTLALAGAALLAPVIWMGHALLVWLDIL